MNELISINEKKENDAVVVVEVAVCQPFASLTVTIAGRQFWLPIIFSLFLFHSVPLFIYSIFYGVLSKPSI